MSRVGFGLIAAPLSAAPAVGQTPPVPAGWERPIVFESATSEFYWADGKFERFWTSD